MKNENGLKYRLLTRSDFDGLVCALLLKEQNLVDDILFVHPRDMQLGQVELTDRDISANLPYTEGIFMCFDHHESEAIRGEKRDNHIIKPTVLSAARVIYDYYGGEKSFPAHFKYMIDAADKIDSASLTMNEVMHPTNWVLLGFITDSRTGFGRFKNFRISNYDLMMKLVDLCRKKTLDEILVFPDIQERIALYRNHEPLVRRQLEKCSRVDGKILITDLRNVDTIYVENRFLRYALYPQINISIQIMWGRNRQNTVFALGRSIFNKTSKVNIGSLILGFEGGGHEGAGACQVDNDKVDESLAEIVKRIHSSDS